MTATDTVTGTITGQHRRDHRQPRDRRDADRDTAPRLGHGRHAPLRVTVTAMDAYGNTATGYTGTVHFTSTDGAAVLPADYTFTAGDAGVHTFTTASPSRPPAAETVTATDTVNGTITGTSASSHASRRGASHLSVNGTPAVGTAGTAAQPSPSPPWTPSATSPPATPARSTSPAATASQRCPPTTPSPPATPAPHTFASAHPEDGRLASHHRHRHRHRHHHRHHAASPSTPPPPRTPFTRYPPPATAGIAFSVTVTAQDAYGNTATGYTGTVHFTSSDGAATAARQLHLHRGDARRPHLHGDV